MDATKFVRDDGGRAAAGREGDAGDCVTRAIAIATGIPYRDRDPARPHDDGPDRRDTVKLLATLKPTDAYPVTVHVEVPEPPRPDGEVVTRYGVSVLLGAYPSSWHFDNLDDAVERWADEGLDRCCLYAEGVRPCDGEFEPADVRASFSRLRGWDTWEVV